MCGDKTVRGAVRSQWSRGRGSMSKTSSPAPAIQPHDFEQIFYVLSGEMNVEIDGEVFRAPAGSLIRFPAGVPHRNWNDEGGEDTLHLAINVPAPILGQPSAKPVR